MEYYFELEIKLFFSIMFLSDLPLEYLICKINILLNQNKRFIDIAYCQTLQQWTCNR